MLGAALSRRRIVMPIIILLVGGMIAIWASQRESARLDEMRQIAISLCEAAARGENLTTRVPTENAMINSQLASAISLACADLSVDPSVLEVVVNPGDGPGFSDGAATHHAFIRILGVDRLGLRMKESQLDQRIVIVGYWVPEPP